METEVYLPEQVEQYSILGEIGEGERCIVRLAANNKTKKFCAVKILPRSSLNNYSLVCRFENEVRTMQQMRHGRIVELLDLFKDVANFYIFMEFCPNGELFQFIIDRGHLSVEQTKIFTIQILEAIQHIHKLGFAHLDLNPTNILIDQNGNLKLSDFGCCQKLSTQNTKTDSSTIVFMSPESLSGRPYDGAKADVWSIGVIVFSMLTGQLPWTKVDNDELIKQITEGSITIPEFLDEPSKNFLKGLLNTSTKDRLTIDETLMHPWLSDAPRYQIDPIPNGISLHKVDEFFKSSAFDDMDVSAKLSRELSLNPMSYNKTAKMIKRKLSIKASVSSQNVEYSHKASVLRRARIVRPGKSIKVAKTYTNVPAFKGKLSRPFL